MTVAEVKAGDVFAAVAIAVPILIAAFAAVVSAMAATASKKAGEASQAAASTQLMSQFSQNLRTQAMCKCRREVAGAALARRAQSGDHLYHVLDELEIIAGSAKDAVIPTKMVWSSCGDFMVHYWVAFEPEISNLRRDVPSFYEDLAWIVDELNKITVARGIADPIGYYRLHQDTFFEGERSIHA